MNKTRNIIKIFIVGLLTLNFMSCSDFLDKNPLDQISSEAFWKTEEEADMALAGVYARLRCWTFDDKDGSFDVMGGDAWGTLLDLSQGNIEPTSGSMVSNIYADCYRGISSCNFFLANVEKTPIDAAKLNKYKAEAMFLRALFYFTLTEHYGGVPLYTSPVTDVAYTNGHAVKGSALALKARVLLHNQRWADAAAAANQVIQDSKFRLYLDSDDAEGIAFRNLFLVQGQNNNPEILFSIRYLKPDVVHPDRHL